MRAPWGRQQGGAGRVTAEDLRVGARRELQTSIGRVVIGRPSFAVMRGVAAHVPDLVRFVREGPSAEGLAAVDGVIERILVAGVISPRLGTDPEKGPTPRDFTFEDQVTLLHGILSLCGNQKAP